MNRNKEITKSLNAENERDNLIFMVEHARKLARNVLDVLNKIEPEELDSDVGVAKNSLRRIIALNPPAASDGSNVKDE